MLETKIAVVGAGAAGLGAAKQLAALGVDHVVLEAAPRIGGRAHTEAETFGIPFDQGCAWLHAADRNPFYQEAVAAGWTLHHHDMKLDHLYFGREKATTKQMRRMAAAEAEFEAELAQYKGQSDRVSELLERKRYHHAAGTFSGPMDFAQDVDEISVSDFAKAANLDPNYFTKEGFGALVHRWGASVPVTLDCPVREIRWDGPKVELDTPHGVLKAEKVLVTVSTGVLVHAGIRFSPDLPWDHEAAIEDLPMGLLTKIPVVLRHGAAGKHAFEDVLVETRAHRDIFFLFHPFSLDLAVGFVGGDFAWEIECAGEEAAIDFAMQVLVRLFGSDVRKAAGKGAMTRWGSNRLTRGAYAAARPGQAHAREVLATPVDGRIWFAGEALAGPLMQTCGGARLSGEAVAQKMAMSCAGYQTNGDDHEPHSEID